MWKIRKMAVFCCVAFLACAGLVVFCLKEMTLEMAFESGDFILRVERFPVDGHVMIFCSPGRYNGSRAGVRVISGTDAKRVAVLLDGYPWQNWSFQGNAFLSDGSTHVFTLEANGRTNVWSYDQGHTNLHAMQMKEFESKLDH